MTDSDGSPVAPEPDEDRLAEPAAPAAEPGLTSLDLEAGRVDTAMVLGWVGLALVPCCGLGGLVSLVGAVLGVIRVGKIGGRDRRLAVRARGAILLGVIGFLLGAAIIVWFAMTFRSDMDAFNDVKCAVTSC